MHEETQVQEPAPQELASPDEQINQALGEVYDKVTTEPEEVPQQPRDEMGRYASKDEPAPLEEDGSTQIESPDQTPEEGQEPAPQAIEAPNSWSADVAALWGDLPPELQAYIAERESDSHKQISQQGIELKQYQPIREVLDHFEPMLGQRDPAQVVGELFQVAQNLEANPVESLRFLADAYNVDLTQFAANHAASDEDDWTDPAIRKLEQKFDAFANQITAQTLNTGAAAQHQAQIDEAERVVSEFSKDKPYWSDVEVDVARRIDFLRSLRPYAQHESLLKQAYEEAIWANAEVREKVLADDRKAEADRRQKEHEEKQRKAEKLSVVNAGSDGASGLSAFEPVHWEDDDAMSRLYDEVTAV